MDECLRGHSGYSAMDFRTRDRYRQAIEELAKRSSPSEVEIARKGMDKVRGAGSNAGANKRRREPGYYLIGGEFASRVLTHGSKHSKRS